MKNNFLVLITLIILGFNSSRVIGQTTALKQLDTSAFSKWPVVSEGGMITNDGKYVCYSVAPSLLEQWNPAVVSTVVKSLHSEWIHTIKGTDNSKLQFTQDSRSALFQNSDSSLWMLTLGDSQSLLSKEVAQFKLTETNPSEYLIILTNNNEFICKNLQNNKEHQLKGVVRFEYNPKKSVIYIFAKTNGNYRLSQFDPVSGKQTQIWEGSEEISKFVCDEASGNLAFADKGGKWYIYEDKNKEAREFKISNTDNLTFEGAERFEAGGKLLILKMKGPALAPVNPSVNPVKIFSYQDPEYYKIVDNAERRQPEYLASYEINTGKYTRLEYDNDRLRSISVDGSKALIRHVEAQHSESEYYWSRAACSEDYVIYLVTGKKVIIKNHLLGTMLSPGGEWVIGQNNYGGDLFCMNTGDGTMKNLTARFPIPLRDFHWSDEPQMKNSRALGFYNWSKDGKSIVMYDRFDIWQVDPSGQKAAVNLTAGVGRKNNIVFRFIEKNNPQLLLEKGDNIMIAAFNEETKENGFYKLEIGNPASLQQLTMGPYYYHMPHQTVYNWAAPVKAKSADVWLIPRQSESESPNWFWTKDFRIYNSLSNVYPEKEYEWFTTELINFTTKMGVKCKAILYKPKNFDPKKKYPVLFNYYQSEETDKLHMFRFPAFTDAYFFNFPMMLARGYMVCLTDTRQKIIGETARCLVDAIEGAADELAKRPYIDSKRFGGCGGSFGGYGTNCLAALSKKFAALVPISGVSDLVSIYGTVPGLGEEHTENRQCGMGVSLGTDPERYLRNSPLAHVKKVTTPILIVNTLKDNNVNVLQGIEWFISLRREGKRAWMLQYQHEDHGVHNKDDDRDFHIRMNQFFDHYLKDAPAPVWMTQGIPVNDRGVRAGYEYDTKIKTPEPSRLIMKSKK